MTQFFRKVNFVVVAGRLTLPRQVELAKVFTVNMPLVDKSLLI